ncbi:MAG: hypothetical protein AAGD14_17075, partial [Planctomycetota bacterium]
MGTIRILAPCLLLLGLLIQPAPAEESRHVGTVLDGQGTALVRPVGGQRWTPIGPRALLLPGDQVRTPKRGAHAVELRLAGGGRLVLGPGTLIEIPNAHGARLYAGDLEAKGALTLTGPGDFARQGDGTVLLRAAGRVTKELKSAPRWLAGYRNSSTDEWMGSL